MDAFQLDLYNILGLIGAILILFSFYRTSIGQWTNKSLWYELDNLFGAILLIIYQVKVGAYISVGVNIIWAFVALRGVSSIAERRNWNKVKFPARKPKKRSFWSRNFFKR